MTGARERLTYELAHTLNVSPHTLEIAAHSMQTHVGYTEIDVWAMFMVKADAEASAALIGEATHQ